jgi:hypothetical protein
MIEGNGVGPTVTMRNSYRVFQKENALTSVFERNTNNSDTSNCDFLPEIPSVSGFDYTLVRASEVPQIKFNAMLNEEAIKQFVVAFDNESTDGMDHAKDAKNPNLLPNDINFFIFTCFFN